MPNQPVRVLHVLGSLGRGGAETWATQVIETIDPQRVQIDFLVHRHGGIYEDRVRACGASIFHCGSPRQPLMYISNVKSVLKENGPYTVVHSHLQNFNGLIMKIAHRARIPGRIAHARNSNDGRGQLLHRIIYHAIMRYWIKRYATHLFAVSTEAAEGVFGRGVMQDGSCKIMTGIDFSPFQVKVDRNQLRDELQIPKTALIIGHIGSFRQQKNHQFLVKIAQELRLLQPNVLFLLIGDGSLQQSIKDSVHTLGIEHNFRFLGERSDISRLINAMDIFVFPSLYEGLPRVLLEAQATGIPCIASSKITKEADAGFGDVLFMDVQDDPKLWAHTILTFIQRNPATRNGSRAVTEFEKRGLTITANASELTNLYEQIANVSTSS